MDDSLRMDPLDDDGHYDDDDASLGLGGVLVSPRNADRRWQAQKGSARVMLPALAMFGIMVAPMGINR